MEGEAMTRSTKSFEASQGKAWAPMQKIQRGPSGMIQAEMDVEDNCY
jgi:hypothetical protein